MEHKSEVIRAILYRGCALITESEVIRAIFHVEGGALSTDIRGDPGHFTSRERIDHRIRGDSGHFSC